jgi:hypothetical protein
VRQRARASHPLFRVYSESEFLRLLERPAGDLVAAHALRGGSVADRAPCCQGTVTVPPIFRRLSIVTGAAAATVSAGAAAALVISHDRPALHQPATASALAGGSFSRAESTRARTESTRARTGPPPARTGSKGPGSGRVAAPVPAARSRSRNPDRRGGTVAPHRVQLPTHAASASPIAPGPEASASAAASSAQVSRVSQRDFTFER